MNNMAGKLHKLVLTALIALLGIITTHTTLPFWSTEVGVNRYLSAQPVYPAPELPEPSKLGLNLARSMKLLSQSSKWKRNTVRVLFYGQSITRDEWWKAVETDLKRRFPQAEVVTQNLALGGFSAQHLALTVERDLLSFYPDLIIFHVYGNHHHYEEILQKMRVLTTADLALQTDHLEAKTEPEQPDNHWSSFMNELFLPRMAEKYQCELIDVRSSWRQYLLDNHYHPSQLLRDSIHLNDQGNFLMAELVKNYLRANPKAKEPWPERVKTYQLNRDVNYDNGRLTLEFIGNRVDVVSSTFGEAKAEILIDGQHPSAIPELYIFTRPNYTPTTDWPWEVSAPVRLNWQQLPLEEDWTITILEVKPQESETLNFTFRLTGTKTGMDGVGSNQEAFISNSGRVVILPEHWWLNTASGQSSPIKPGYELKFRARLLGTDIYQKPKFRGFGRESTVTLAQGLKNEHHTLEIIPLEPGKVPIKAIRLYHPPLRITDLQLENMQPEILKPNLRERSAELE